MDSTSEAEARKYDAVWATAEYRNSPSPGRKILSYALNCLKINKVPSSIADFGCGAGQVVTELGEIGLLPIGIDISSVGWLGTGPFLQASLWELPRITVDYGLCCDVMEHIPTDKVLATLTAIRAAVKHAAFFQIALFDDVFGPQLLGEPLHLTIASPVWWVAQFGFAGWDTNAHVDNPHGNPYLLVTAT